MRILSGVPRIALAQFYEDTPMHAPIAATIPLLLALLSADAPAQESEWRERWSQPLGPGYSSPHLDRDRVLVTHRSPIAGAPSLGGAAAAAKTASFLVCLDLATGAPRWRARFDDPPRDGQENYGGGTGPHAAPLVHHGVALALGFGGGLHAFEAESGEERWSLDLVAARGAPPVQFGFAASPIALGNDVLVCAGGEQGGVLAIDPLSGEIRWASAPLEVSYVTPVLGVGPQGEPEAVVVCVGRDATVGLDARDGKTLWSQPHKRPELTNFAMPHLAGTGVLVSGQGNRGLVRFEVTPGPEGLRTEEAWWTRGAQFSHGRTLVQDGLLYGSTGSQLCCVDVATGRLVFRQRGFGECSLVQAGPFTVLQTEGGELLATTLSPERVEVWSREKVLAPKAWCAPVPVGADAGGGLLCRDGKRLVRLDLPPAPSAEDSPIEVIDTGGTRATTGAFQLAPSRLAFAVGRYTARDREPIVLRVEEGAFSARLGEGEWSPAVARSPADCIVPALNASFELLPQDGPVPAGMLWTDTSAEWQGEFQPLDPSPWTADQRARITGTWTIAEGLSVTLAEENGTLVGSSTVHPGVSFTCTPDSPLRLWLDASNGNYGIPRALLVLPESGEVTQLTVHQEDDSYTAKR